MEVNGSFKQQSFQTNFRLYPFIIIYVQDKWIPQGRSVLQFKLQGLERMQLKFLLDEQIFHSSKCVTSMICYLIKSFWEKVVCHTYATPTATRRVICHHWFGNYRIHLSGEMGNCTKFGICLMIRIFLYLSLYVCVTSILEGIGGLVAGAKRSNFFMC